MSWGTAVESERDRAQGRVVGVVDRLGAYGIFSDADLAALDARIRRGVDDLAAVGADVAGRLGVTDVAPLLALLYDRYLEPERAYHLVFHPTEVAARVLDLAADLEFGPRDRDAVVAAALIHDLVQDYDIDGSPHPGNESRTIEEFHELVLPQLAVDPGFAPDVSTLIAATALGADISATVRAHRPDAPDHARLELLAATLVDADLGGIAQPTIALDNKLLRVEWRAIGADRIHARQSQFVRWLRSRPAGPFLTDVANRRWGLDATRNLDTYAADLGGRAVGR